MLHTLRPLKRYRGDIQVDVLAREIRPLWRQVRHSAHWAPLRRLMHEHSLHALRATDVQVNLDTITASLPVGGPHDELLAACRNLIPWRVGPYQLGDLVIDSEWRSDQKWRRIEPIIGSVKNQRVADVGCSNGYFLFKVSQFNPEVALGFDPIDRCWLQFGLLQSLFQIPHLGFIPTGLASLKAFPNFFDLILCMGVLYHQRDPSAACARLFEATRPGGRVFLESLVIDQPGSHLLRPQERYAKMRNAWVIPTAEALVTLMTEAGFSDIELHRFGPITSAEQRRTEWAPYESLADFLDPNDSSKTVEGYPAPHSAAVLARRPL